ncbi:MAG: glycosyl hydrolase family 28 protein [Kiritimatiellae bacterium]|nr:glycosyl hydrolase family 28 protein [Kiritimatiellia bacterium]
MFNGDNLDLGAVADGVRDAAPALQELLDRRGEIRIPGGHYRLGATLAVHSDTSIIAAPDACFQLADGVGKHCRNFMITNANPGNGNANISLRGGRWDANNRANPRGADPKGGYFSAPLDRLEYDLMAYTGVAINFTNVRHLAVRDLTVHNPESFFVRIGEVDDFLVENITLSADAIRPNQDGVHVGGFSENGVIRGIRAAGAGVPNDDMVALNADDDIERQCNLGMRRGPIRNVVVEDIEAEDAYTFIRLFSVEHPIEDVAVRRMRGSCRVHGLNLNNWRFPKGVGHIRRVRFEDIALAKSHAFDYATAIVHISLGVEDLEIRRLQRQPGTPAAVKTLLLDNNRDLTMTVDGRSEEIRAETGYTLSDGDIGEMRFQ